MNAGKHGLEKIKLNEKSIAKFSGGWKCFLLLMAKREGEKLLSKNGIG